MATYGYTGSIVKVTVQNTGTYDITAYGAGGGVGGNGNYRGGAGAQAGGNFALTAGERLEIVAGGAGKPGSNGSAGGGGGASEVFANTGAGGAYVPLLVAGGGGGGGGDFAVGGGPGGNATGYGGSGLGGTAGKYSKGGGGGAGVKSDGGSATNGGSGGLDLAHGGAGGTSGGGFSGGGGHSGSAGGGGGYTGGGGGTGSYSRLQGNYLVSYGGLAGAGGTSFLAASGTAVAAQTKNGTAATNAGNGSVTITPNVTCYANGTRIRVLRASSAGAWMQDVAVEDLAVGDLAVTASGALRPIRWIGRMEREAATCPSLAVVRITAGAVAPGLPVRDLFVSPDHHVAVDDVLVPAWALVNAWTVLREPVERATFWHVELESHDLLLAEGLAAESYLDCGNRAGFERAASPLARIAAAAGATLCFCLPAISSGPKLAAIRAWLLARAAMLGAETTADSAVALLADGVALAPAAVAGDSHTWDVPDGTRALRLVSRAAVPFEASADPAADGRRLGVRLHALVLDGTATPLAAVDAHRGWHYLEADGGWRWSDGDAALPLARTVTLGLAPFDAGYPLKPDASRSDVTLDHRASLSVEPAAAAR